MLMKSVRPMIRSAQPSSGEVKAMYEQAKTVGKGSEQAASRIMDDTGQSYKNFAKQKLKDIQNEYKVMPSAESLKQSAINGILFHGTDHPFQPGDLVRGETSVGGFPEPGIAYATPDRNLARRFGKHVFQVKPLDIEKTYASRYTDDAYEVFSPVGFEVISDAELPDT